MLRGRFMCERVRIVVFWVVGCVALLVPPQLSAQTSATLTGQVADSSQAVLPGVALTLTQPSTGLTRTAVSGRDGRFVLAVLPAGAYELRAELAGIPHHHAAGPDHGRRDAVPDSGDGGRRGRGRGQRVGRQTAGPYRDRPN